MANFNSSLTSTQIETILAGINAITGTLQRNSDGTIQAASLYPMLTGSSAPTTSTVGSVTQLYRYGNLLYCCTAVSGLIYTWEQVGGSGSGGSTPTTAVATLTASGWSNYTQTVNVTAVTTANLVQASPASSSYTAFHNAGIRPSAQGTGTVTFTCNTVPSVDVEVYLAIFG